MNERRKHPRVNASLPIKFSSDDFDIVTQTKNISACGTYCYISRPIELMTKLDVLLLIPIKGKKNNTVKKVVCTGIVVRVAPPESQDKDKSLKAIAIYFSEITPSNKKIILSYIDSLHKEAA